MDRDIQDWEDVIVVFAQVENVRITHGGHLAAILNLAGLVALLLSPVGAGVGHSLVVFF